MRSVKAERLRRGWRQIDLAVRARITPAEISRIETGRLLPSPGQTSRLAEALELSQERLLDEVTEPSEALESRA